MSQFTDSLASVHEILHLAVDYSLPYCINPEANFYDLAKYYVG